jgi:hypothetical protein
MSRVRLLLLLAVAVVAATQTSRPANAGFSNGQGCIYDDQCPRGFHCCSCQCIIGICDPVEACPQ